MFGIVTLRRHRRRIGAAGLIGCFVLLACVRSPARAAEDSGFYVDLPSVRLWVTDSGGSGQPVIMLHPNTGNVDSWQNVTPALVQAGYRVIAFDRPGWGKSMLREGAKPVSVAEDLDALADDLKLQKFHIVSVAGGGYIAVDYAAWHPERVQSLVVAASGLGMKGDSEADTFRKNSAIPGFDNFPPEVKEMSPSYRGMNPEGVARWKEIEQHSQQPGANDAPLHTPNTDDKVAALSVPLFVIAGDVDLQTPSAAIRLWAKHLKEPYDWLLITEAGHSVTWEQPEVFDQAVLAFLRKH